VALPKRKQSKSRRDKRRTHWKLESVGVSECSNCHQAKLPHRACASCGYYNGRSVRLPNVS